MSSRVVVMGMGYVGLPMALRAAEAGHRVVGLDTNHQIVRDLNAGISHVSDVKDSRIQAEMKRETFSASCDARVIRKADVVIVCVPTPLAPDGTPDLSSVRAASKVIGENIGKGTLVILESTTYPGTTEEYFAPIVLSQQNPAPTNVHIAFSPERINPGDNHFTIQNTPKVVGGLTDEATLAAKDFYSTFIDEVWTASGAREAEMSKLLENTFRHVNIALMNEMVRFCDELNIDLWDAIRCAASKPFGYMAFWPGPGVGGHCIPVDPSYLSHRVKAKLGYSFRMVELAEEINHAAPLYVARRAWNMLNECGLAMKGSKILLLGVTYKADVPDLRETPAQPLVDHLITCGAQVSYHDPWIETWKRFGEGAWDRLESVKNVDQAASNADLVVLLQPHRQYDVQKLARASKLFLDTRGTVRETEHVRRL